MLANAKHEQFCQQFLLDLNVTKAAVRAGYSEKSAKQDGHRIFHRPDVQARIQFLVQERTGRTEVKQLEVVQGLHLEATYHGRDSSHSARVNAWTQLGRHLGMFRDVVETKDLTLEELMREAAKDEAATDDGPGR